ncbi:hypothetical protein PLCT2_02949 [Planctomycetaceae bacterium]|nr:hypothetical protein PLCT2_02949 [Planctomycetaceae bacterium]
MLLSLFTLDNALMLGALVIGPALMFGFILLMSRLSRAHLMRRKPEIWNASDPAFVAATKVANLLSVPVDRLRPKDRLVADLRLDHYQVVEVIDEVDDQPAAARFLKALHERTLADLGMLMSGIGDW